MNGEKAIPIPVEMARRQNVVVKESIILGTGRTRLGLAIISSEAASNPTSQGLVTQIWPTIEIENSKTPAYAAIAPEMVMLLPTGTQYPQIDKDTAIRQAFYKIFAQHIEQLYLRLQIQTGVTSVLSGQELWDWLRRQILLLTPGLAEEDVADEIDLFSLSIDSLQSSRLHSSRAKYDHEKPSTAGLVYETQATQDTYPGRGDSFALSPDLVTKFVRQFLKTSWGPKSSPPNSEVSKRH